MVTSASGVQRRQSTHRDPLTAMARPVTGSLAGEASQPTTVETLAGSSSGGRSTAADGCPIGEGHPSLGGATVGQAFRSTDRRDALQSTQSGHYMASG